MKSEINPAKLTFVTGNPTKFAEAQKVAKLYNVDLQAKKLEIDEIQSNDPKIVALAKAKSAYQILKYPIVVHDGS